VDIDPAARARLASLGYVATFASRPAGPRQTLADPKDKVEVFNLMTEAQEQSQGNRVSDRALAALQKVVASDPEVIDAWVMLGTQYSRRQEFDRALASLERALALKPDYDVAAFNLANVYRLLGRNDDALRTYRRFVEVAPANAAAHQRLGQVLVEEGRLEEAQNALLRALELQPAMAAARNSLGAQRLKQGDLTAGERDIRAALDAKPDLPLGHFNLALAAEQRGDLPTAVAEYKKEIELHPKSYMAEFNLGKVFEKLDNVHGQETAFRASIASNPVFAEGHLFLAKLCLDRGALTEAMKLAQRGIELKPTGDFAPLGHFVLADVYSREGRRADAARAAAEGRRLASRSRSN
jgi:tetratricopeptide (TPR) repeat protein